MSKENLKIAGSWYSPLEYLETLKSTQKAGLLETTSSAGNWTGFIIKKVGKKFIAYFFHQENNGGGFSLSIGERFASFAALPTSEEVENLAAIYWNDFNN